MSNTKHTPGPWVHKGGGDIVAAPGKVVACCFTTKEDSELIAKAWLIPELLQALQAGMAALNECVPIENHPDPGAIEDCRQIMLAAIKKATK